MRYLAVSEAHIYDGLSTFFAFAEYFDRSRLMEIALASRISTVTT